MHADACCEFLVPETLAGARLDRAVAQLTGVSRRLARLAIAEGRVALGKHCVRIFTREVRTGQRLRVTAEATAPAADAARGAAPGAPQSLRRDAPGGPRHDAAALEIVHLDPWVVVINKPAGLLSEPDRFGAPSAETLLPQLLRARGEPDEVWLVHRLDAGTSGLLLFARRRSAARRLFAAFADRAVDKTYWAVAAGALAQATRVQAPLARVAGTRHGVQADGKPADTLLTPLAQRGAYTLVEARPKTGRTHQIRVHLAHLQCPIVGDALYGGPRYVAAADAPRGAPLHAVGRPLLHAHRLALAHPSEKGLPALQLHAPMPQDMAQCVAQLGLA